MKKIVVLAVKISVIPVLFPVGVCWSVFLFRPFTTAALRELAMRGPMRFEVLLRHMGYAYACEPRAIETRPFRYGRSLCHLGALNVAVHSGWLKAKYDPGGHHWCRHVTYSITREGRAMLKLKRNADKK